MKRFLALSLVCIATGVRAQTGEELRTELEYDEAAARKDGSIEHAYNAGHGVGFVVGEAFGLAAGGVLCFPNDIQAKQALAIVKNYLDAHPERWQEKSHYLIRDALLAVYACKRAK